MNVTERIILNDSVTQQVTTGSGIGNVQTQLLVPPNYSFQNGTSTGGTIANQIDLVCDFADTSLGTNSITLAASASHTFILSALVDPVSGVTNAFVRLMRYSIQVVEVNPATPNDSLTSAPGGTHGLTGIGTDPNITGLLMKVWDNPGGLPISSGSQDQVIVTNNGSNAVTFYARFSGCST